MSSEEEGIEYTYEEAIEAIGCIMRVPGHMWKEPLFTITFESRVYKDTIVKFYSCQKEHDYHYLVYTTLGVSTNSSEYNSFSLNDIFVNLYSNYQGKNIKINFPFWNGGVNIKPVKKD